MEHYYIGGELQLAENKYLRETATGMFSNGVLETICF